MSATSPRGQTTRDHANVQRISIEKQGGPFDALAFHIRWAVSWLLWLTAQTVWAALYVPAVGGSVVFVLLAWTFHGVVGLLLAALMVGSSAVLWVYWRPQAFVRHTSGRVNRIMRRIRYRAGWDDILVAAGAKAVDARRREAVPRLVWVHLGEHEDELTVQLCPGVTVDTLRSKVDYMVSEWGALWVEISSRARPRGWARVTVVYRDPLADDVTSGTDRPVVDLTRLPVGRRRDGQPLLLRLAGRHVLVGGSSGAGKGSFVTALLWSLRDAIHDGSVRVIGIDPKAGMEFGMYPGLFWMLAYRTDAQMVTALEHAAEVMEARAESLRGWMRSHQHNPNAPYYVVIVDELLSLAQFIGDRKLRERAEAAMGRIMSKGRAPGFSLIGLTQDPRKEVLKYRNLFTLRLALRTDSATEVGMLLGDEAHTRGARCEEISLGTPGIGYVVDDEQEKAPVRVRLDWHNDDDMRWLSAAYEAPERAEVPDTISPADGSRTRKGA